MHVLQCGEVEAQGCKVFDLSATHDMVLRGLGFDLPTKTNDSLNVGVTQAALLHPLASMLSERDFKCRVSGLKLFWHRLLLIAKTDTPNPGQAVRTMISQSKQRLAMTPTLSHHHFLVRNFLLRKTYIR
jgi:hypothetical protein